MYQDPATFWAIGHLIFPAVDVFVALRERLGGLGGCPFGVDPTASSFPKRLTFVVFEARLERMSPAKAGRALTREIIF